MEDLVNMIVDGESPSSISDKIKDVLFSKSAEKIDALRPYVSNSVFGLSDESSESEEN
jgi:hypothetical protein